MVVKNQHLVYPSSLEKNGILKGVLEIEWNF